MRLSSTRRRSFKCADLGPLGRMQAVFGFSEVSGFCADAEWRAEHSCSDGGPMLPTIRLLERRHGSIEDGDARSSHICSSQLAQKALRSCHKRALLALWQLWGCSYCGRSNTRKASAVAYAAATSSDRASPQAVSERGGLLLFRYRILFDAHVVLNMTKLAFLHGARSIPIPASCYA